jgi:hypothetical protein
MIDDPFLWKELVSVISVATALVAVIVGPLVSWKIAKRQITASNVSSKRQVWIDELRRDVAEALALLSRIQELKRPSPDLGREEQLDVFDRRMEAELRAIELLMRIKLRLNPNEQEHNELVTAFQEASRVAPDPQWGETDEARRRLQAEFGAARDNVLEITQKILKSEWNRVRRGE